MDLRVLRKVRHAHRKEMIGSVNPEFVKCVLLDKLHKNLFLMRSAMHKLEAHKLTFRGLDLATSSWKSIPACLTNGVTSKHPSFGGFANSGYANFKHKGEKGIIGGVDCAPSPESAISSTP